MKLFAIGVGESVRAYQDKLPYIFENYDTITVHNGLLKLYEHYGLFPTYYSWGDPFASLHSMRFLDNLKSPIHTKIFIPDSQYTSYENYRKYHGTTRASANWGEYIDLINSLINKGFNITLVPTKTTKIKFPSLEDRFNKKGIWIGTVPYTGDSAEDRNALETKLTGLVLPLAYLLGYTELKVLGFDCIGGRFYDPIEGVPQAPFKKEQLKYLLENLQIWNSWKDYHNIDIISVVEDKYTINNQVLKYQSI